MADDYSESAAQGDSGFWQKPSGGSRKSGLSNAVGNAARDLNRSSTQGLFDQANKLATGRKDAAPEYSRVDVNSLPKLHRGGPVKRTGPYRLLKGERVVARGKTGRKSSR